jgi:hypothetical protein
VSPREKLVKLIEKRRTTRAAVAEEGEVSYGTFLTYIRKKRPRMPSADKGVAIAFCLNVPAEWLWSEADWPPPITPEPPSLQSVSDHDLTEEFCRRRESLVTEIATLSSRLCVDDLERLVQLTEKPALSREEQVVLDRGVRDVVAMLSARTDLVMMTPAEHAALLMFTDAEREATGRLLGRLVEKSSYNLRAMPFDLWFLMHGVPPPGPPDLRQPADAQKAEPKALSTPSNTPSLPDVPPQRDSTRPTNAGRLGKRPAGRKRRKAESP